MCACDALALSKPVSAAPRHEHHVEALTQAWVDEFASMMASKAQDWHMTQRDNM